MTARCDEAIAQGFADCEALVVAMAEEHLMALDATAINKRFSSPAEAAEYFLASFSLAVSLGQHRSAETNESAVLSAHRTAVNRAQAQAAGRASAKKRWGKETEMYETHITWKMYGTRDWNSTTIRGTVRMDFDAAKKEMEARHGTTVIVDRVNSERVPEF